MTDELPPLPDDMLQLDEAYPGMAVADQIRAYGDERAAAAVLAEREKNAKVCDDEAARLAEEDEDECAWTVRKCAAAIRKGE